MASAPPDADALLALLERTRRSDELAAEVGRLAQSEQRASAYRRGVMLAGLALVVLGIPAAAFLEEDVVFLLYLGLLCMFLWYVTAPLALVIHERRSEPAKTPSWQGAAEVSTGATC